MLRFYKFGKIVHEHKKTRRKFEIFVNLFIFGFVCYLLLNIFSMYICMHDLLEKRKIIVQIKSIV